MSSTLYKNSGLVLKQKVIQEWVPDPPTPYNPPSSGYKPSQTEPITWSVSGYHYKGKTFFTYDEAVAYRDSGAGSGGYIAGPGTYSPQTGYYYVKGKPASNIFYVRDPITGEPITIKRPRRY
jgi:hypothetical protein